MSQFLFHASYTSESWSVQIREHANALERIQPLVESLGGTVTSFYYALGESDIVAIADFPGAEDAAAFSLAAMAGGSLRSITTTPLLTIEQGIAAMHRAGEAGGVYTPPVPTSRIPVA